MERTFVSPLLYRSPQISCVFVGSFYSLFVLTRLLSTGAFLNRTNASNDVPTCCRHEPKSAGFLGGFRAFLTN